MHKTNDTAVIVLGMHRSGTSCLAGCLEAAGLFLGDVNVQAPFNAHGNRESRRIMDLHEAVLADNDGAWDAPPETTEWQATRLDELNAIIASYPEQLTWGFKDPRTLITLETWLQVLPHARLVGTFRHPLAVAASLHHRNGFDTDTALGLWQNYNQRLLDYHRRYKLPLLCFDWPQPLYSQRLGEVANMLGLPEAERSVDFFAGALRKNSAPPDAQLPGHIRSLYQRLLERAA